MSDKKYNELIISTTDTVLGIGGKVNEKIKKLIYEIKGRDENKKLIILVSTTLVVNNQGFRMPNQKKLLEYLEQNGPIYMSSCNLSNAPVCKTIEDAKLIFPEIKNIYNFGKMSQQPSQIIRVEDGEILRK